MEAAEFAAPVTPKKVEQGGILEHAARSDIHLLVLCNDTMNQKEKSKH